MILFQPTELLAVRTVGHHALHVAPLRTLYQTVGLCEDGVGTFKRRAFFGRVVDEAALQTGYYGQSLWVGLAFEHGILHLYVSETVVGEAWMPRLCGVAAYGIFIVVLATRLPLVAHALLVQVFRYEHCHLLSRSALHLYLRESGEVLSHVGNEGMWRHRALGLFRCRSHGVGRQIVPCLDAEALHYLYRLCGLRFKNASGTFHKYGILPCRIVEVRHTGFALYQTGIVRLAAVDAVEGDGTESVFP